MINGKHSPDLTSYDLLKAAALLLMFCDHLGYYFWPDEMWLRLAGRFSVPVWFFLIGYARTRDVPPRIWIFGCFLIFSSLLSGQFLFPLDILFTLALTRLLIDHVMARALRTHKTFFGMFLFLSLLSAPSSALVEYGTIGLLFAMLGFLRRRQADLEIRFLVLLAFAAGCTVSYILQQLMIMPDLSASQFVVFCVGVAALTTLLFNFKPVTYPGFSRHAWFLLPVMKLLGRYTLEIYVIHLLLFQALAMMMYPERFELLQFRFLPASFAAMFFPR